MTTSKLTDANLSRDVYTVNNTSGGTVDGWTRIKVEAFTAAATVSDGSNFAAQLYKNNDGSYKIAFRGTASLTGSGDLIANGSGIALNQWPAELSKGVDFVLRAIQQIQKETGEDFAKAAARLSLTGHSQGGWESQVHSKLFNLTGTGFDSPGAFEIVSTAAYRSEVERLRQIEPGYAGFDGPLKGFEVRQYTFLVGGVNANIPGTTSDKSLLSLGAALLAARSAGVVASSALQALIHRIDNIVQVERARQNSPILYRIAEDGSNQGALSVALSEPWARVLAGSAGGPSADKVADLIDDFLAGQRGTQVAARQVNGVLFVESSNGESLLVKPDGSGSSVTVNGIVATERIFGAGANHLLSTQVQRDDDGNTLLQFTQAGRHDTLTIGPDGRAIAQVTQILDSQGEVVQTEYHYPNRKLEIDYFVGPKGQIISSSGELMRKRGEPGPTIVVDQWGRQRLWDGSHPDGAGYGWVNDSWLTREDSAYTGIAGEGDTGMFDATVSQAFAQLIQSMSAFPAAQQDDSRRRAPFEPAQELQPSPAGSRPERRRASLWDVGP